MIPPCMDCPNRVIGCHTWCKPYQIFKKAKDAENAEKRKAQYTFVTKEEFQRRIDRERNAKYMKRKRG